MSDAAVAKTSGGTGWGWLLSGGIVTMLLGMFLLVYPAAATAGVTLFLGWFMLAAGAIGFVISIVNRDEGGMWTGMLLSALTGIVGLLIVTNVATSVMTLTMFFTIWLLADGVVGTALSIVRRGQGWGWWLASSMLSLLLGLMLLSAWPSSAIWLIGIYAGITFIFRGMMLMFLSFEVRRGIS